MEANRNDINIWMRIAQIAGLFVFSISMLLIVNYAQYKRIDPVETELINSLVLRLNENPEDIQLRNEIRALDLLVRKAYFTNQWQVRTGGYLLLLSVAILIIAMQMMKSKGEKEVVISNVGNSFIEQKKARFWISIGGGFIVILALVFAFLSHNELSTKFTQAAIVTENDNELVFEEEDIAEEMEDVITKLPEPKIIEETTPIETKKVEKTITEPKKEVKLEEKKLEVKKEETPTAIPEKKLAAYPSEEEIRSHHASFRGPGGNGISYHTEIPVKWDATTGENILWRTEIPLHGYNSPIIWENKIFLSGANSNKREVYCIHRNTGEILWTAEVKNIAGSPSKSPKVTDDTGQAAPTLTTDGRRVFAVFANGDIIAFDMEGKQLWSRNLGNTENHYGHSSSLMLYQDILVIQYDTRKSPKLMGLSVSTGETVWSTPRKVKISWASPVIVNTGNKTELLIAADPFVSSYDPKTGKLNWEVDCIFGEVGPSVGYADGVVYAVNEYAKLVAIQIRETPKILWESDEYLSDVPSPVATKDLLFMATSYGVVICYHAKTGEIFWEQEYDNGFYSSPMMVEGKIYLLDMNGIMHVFKVDKEFVSLADSPIGEDAMTTPAFSNGRIYIRGNKHLFCVGSK
ncbi:MAG: PQQ-binding-like beta-propeller repeat protein [Bacteroidales bacterium]|nr:PQQ-binding-like beta-propeller repeat protein [Bacteroidales bacterium]